MIRKLVRRKASAAGSFYPRYKPDLIRVLNKCFTDKKFGPGERFKALNQDQRNIIGGVSPHGGYQYSGGASAYTILKIFKEKIPDTVIILGTDNIGYGKIALLEEGKWETPLGDLAVDSKLSKDLLKNSKDIVGDDSAFVGFPFGREHNIEVQLPFIKYCAGDKDIKIVPIMVSTKSFDLLEKLAIDIANVINSTDKDIVLIGSSDLTPLKLNNCMNPENELEEMRNKDKELIDAFVEFNPNSVFDIALKNKINGPQIITILMLICKKLYANQCKALKYFTSYEKSGNTGMCVNSIGFFSGIILK